MKNLPIYKGRSAEEILNDRVYFDSAGYLYRAISWADYYKRHKIFSAMIYACADARLGIEHLMFEELVLCTDAKISEPDYKACTKELRNFQKMIRKLIPDYEKLTLFSKAILEATSGAPNIIYWDFSEISKLWGKLSHYLHWFGSNDKTIDDHRGWLMLLMKYLKY